MKTLSIYLSELRASFVWHASWLMTLLVFLFLLIGIYPGDQAMKDLVPLLQTSYFEDIIGNFGSASPGYTLWISFMLPFMTIILLIYAMTSGVRTAVQSVSDGTGELFHTLPVSRTEYILTRTVSNFTPLGLYFLIQLIILSIPVEGHFIKFNVLINIGWWGILFCLFGLTFGILFGLLAGNSAKGHQMSILVILLFYAIQILARINSGISSLNDINPLSFYQPDQYILGNGFVKNEKLFGFTYYYYPVLLVILSFVFVILGLIEFKRKDLSDDAGFHLNIFRRFSLKQRSKLSKRDLKIIRIVFFPLMFVKNIFFPKNVRNNPFVIWARPFEKYLPITADFIYSDNMLLFIAFIAIFLFFPVQIGYYPPVSVISESLNSFANSGIFLVFTYGHNLVSYPYLWYMVANSVGIIWIIFFPLTFFWVRKAIRNDGNSGTGEILGGLSLNSRSVVFQRLLAICFEMIFLILIMVFWVIFCEDINNAVYYNQLWEILSIVAMLPLYLFLITFCSIISLIFKQKGGLLSGLFLIGTVISFIISVLNKNLNTWYFRGIFSLYDPVLIIQDKSFFTNNNGLLLLIILSIVSVTVLVYVATKFTWLNITNKKENPNS